MKIAVAVVVILQVVTTSSRHTGIKDIKLFEETCWPPDSWTTIGCTLCYCNPNGNRLCENNNGVGEKHLQPTPPTTTAPTIPDIKLFEETCWPPNSMTTIGCKLCYCNPNGNRLCVNYNCVGEKNRQPTQPTTTAPTIRDIKLFEETCWPPNSMTTIGCKLCYCNPNGNRLCVKYDCVGEKNRQPTPPTTTSKQPQRFPTIQITPTGLFQETPTIRDIKLFEETCWPPDSMTTIGCTLCYCNPNGNRLCVNYNCVGEKHLQPTPPTRTDIKLFQETCWPPNSTTTIGCTLCYCNPNGNRLCVNNNCVGEENLQPPPHRPLRIQITPTGPLTSTPPPLSGYIHLQEPPCDE